MRKLKETTIPKTCSMIPYSKPITKHSCTVICSRTSLNTMTLYGNVQKLFLYLSMPYNKTSICWSYYQGTLKSNFLTNLTSKDIVKNPKFVVDGFDRIDINQGQIGDCWFIAGIGTELSNYFVFTFFKCIYF